MTRLYALILAAIGALFAYLALQPEVGQSVTQLGQSTYYFTVAFIFFVKAALFAAADFVEE